MYNKTSFKEDECKCIKIRTQLFNKKGNKELELLSLKIAVP